MPANKIETTLGINGSVTELISNSQSAINEVQGIYADVIQKNIQPVQVQIVKRKNNNFWMYLFFVFFILIVIGD